MEEWKILAGMPICQFWSSYGVRISTYTNRRLSDEVREKSNNAYMLIYERVKQAQDSVQQPNTPGTAATNSRSAPSLVVGVNSVYILTAAGKRQSGRQIRD